MAITGVGSGALARLIADSTAVKTRMETLTAQAADGRRGALYGDIAPDARRAIDLRAEIGRREAHGTAIDRALGRTAATQDTMSRLSAIVESFLGEAQKINRTDNARITTVAAGAAQAAREVAGLLNETHAGEYLFSGTDTGNPPIPDADGIMSGGMAQDIAAAVASLGGGNAASVLAATKAAAGSDTAGTTPFSAYLSDPARGLTEPRRATLAGDGEAIRTGVFANRNADATSGGETTGSWARDILRGLMTLASLTPQAAASAGDDFDAMMTGVRAGFRSAADALAEEEGSLGLAEKRLESARSRHADLQTTLGTQLAGVEEVDLAETLTALQDTQTRLQASWKALSMMASLSLTSFLR
ncbi:flagellin [Muricoccus radiodurans]|uniref:flagellin n=1 Tax=Muricoccus radiodurans TaxID=2231721 RepID=UPI003CEE40A4